MVNVHRRDPPRACPSTRLVRALQSLSPAVDHDGAYRLLQHLCHLLQRECANDNSRRTLLKRHDSSYIVTMTLTPLSILHRGDITRDEVPHLGAVDGAPVYDLAGSVTDTFLLHYVRLGLPSIYPIEGC